MEAKFENDVTKLKAFQLVQKYGQKDALQMINDEITEKQIEVELLENKISIKGLQTLENIKNNIINFKTL